MKEKSVLERGLALSRWAKVESEVEVDSVRPELGVGKEMPEPVVKSELKEAIQRPQLQGTGPVGVVRVNSQRKAKLAAATEGGKRWYCRACGKTSRAATGPNTSNVSIRGLLW